MISTDWTDRLVEMQACGNAVKWARTQPDLRTAWDACERGDWLLWLAAHLLDRRVVVRASCACARLVLPLVAAGEDRPRIAIETAERWADGHATIEVWVAAADAYDAYVAASASAAAAAAADAADPAAAAAAYAAAYAADAAYMHRDMLARCAAVVEPTRLSPRSSTRCGSASTEA